MQSLNANAISKTTIQYLLRVFVILVDQGYETRKRFVRSIVLLMSSRLLATGNQTQQLISQPDCRCYQFSSNKNNAVELSRVVLVPVVQSE